MGELERNNLEHLIDSATARAEEDWKLLLEGRPASTDQAPRLQDDVDASAQGLAARAGIASGSGHLRNEPDDQGRDILAHSASTSHLQREITILLHMHRLENLGERIAEADDRAARRLQELLDPSVSHTWLWNINLRCGSRMCEEDFLINISSRLGAQMVGEDAKCQLCGELLDRSVGHGLCCARSEATRGHYAVVSTVVDGLVTVDPGVRTEVSGLVPSADRPADILTTAGVPGASTAIDVTIAAPDAKAAGKDACATAFRRKMTRYHHYFPTLRRQGVIFRPMVWSAEGRAHPATSRLLENAIRLFRNRHGIEEAAAMRRRWRHEIGVALQRRKAAMLRAVMPKHSARQVWLSGGGLDDIHGQLLAISADEEAEKEVRGEDAAMVVDA